MLAPVLGATFLVVLLFVALIASWRRSRALLLATHALREGHARRLLEERITQEQTLFDRERTAFLADVKVVAAALEQRYPAARPIHPLLARVLHEGRTQSVSHGHEADLAAAGDDGWRPVAALLVPLLARGRALGVVSLFSFESGRRFGPGDRALAEDLARRIALGVDNARLYHAADEAHRRFHDLVEGLGAIIWEADAVRRHHTFVSGRAVALLGHPLARWHDEYRVLTADGRIVWVLDLVRVVRHADGGVHHLRGVMVDVTQGKSAELAQREGRRPGATRPPSHRWRRSRMPRRTRSTTRSPSSWATSSSSYDGRTRRP